MKDYQADDKKLSRRIDSLDAEVESNREQARDSYVKKAAVQLDDNNVDTHAISGFYYGYSGAHGLATIGDNPFPIGTGAFTLTHNTGLNDVVDYSTQIAMESTADAGMEVRIRSIAAGSWGNWQTVLTDSNNNISGTTGNGSYIRFQDGTMICYLPLKTASSTVDVTWTFPSAFIDSSVAVTGTTVGSSSVNLSIRCRIPTATSVDFSVFNTSDTRVVTNIALQVIGKWK